jgi:hypothetical protein
VVTIPAPGLSEAEILDTAPPAAVASVVLLVLFFHPWLVLGVLIDLGLLWGVLVAGGMPQGGSLT